MNKHNKEDNLVTFYLNYMSQDISSSTYLRTGLFLGTLAAIGFAISQGYYSNSNPVPFFPFLSIKLFVWAITILAPILQLRKAYCENKFWIDQYKSLKEAIIKDKLLNFKLNTNFSLRDTYFYKNKSKKLKEREMRETKPKINKEWKNWLIKCVIEVVLLGLILFFMTYYITNSLNPNPIIEKSCYKDGNSTYFVFHNPSRAPAEDFNMIVFDMYGGGSKSYADYELCSADIYSFQPKYTLIHCDYIPPKGNIEIGINFNNKTKSNFIYSSWGKTSPKEDFEENNYSLYC